MSVRKTTTQIIPKFTNTLISEAIDVGSYRNIVITAVGTGTFSVRGTVYGEPVDFTATSTITNPHALIVLADLTAASTYNTSLAVSSSTKLAEVNTNLLTYISIVRSDTGVAVSVSASDNQ